MTVWLIFDERNIQQGATRDERRMRKWVDVINGYAIAVPVVYDKTRKESFK